MGLAAETWLLKSMATAHMILSHFAYSEHGHRPSQSNARDFHQPRPGAIDLWH